MSSYRFLAEYLAGTPAAPTQKAYPISDIDVGAWQGYSPGGGIDSVCYDKVDEPTTPDDTDYAFVLVPDSPWWFKLGPTTTPALLTGTAGIIRALSPQSRSVQFDLYQGYLGTLIGTRTYPLTAGWAQFAPAFTDPELANVTDLNDIHGRLIGLA